MTTAPDTEGQRAAMRRFFEETWQQGSLAPIRELMHPDLLDHNPLPNTSAGRRGYEETVEIFRNGLSDMQMTLLHQVVDGDTAVDHWNGTAVHTGDFAGVPATGKTLHLRGLNIGRFENGVIVERWAQVNMLDLLQQLGVIPGGSDPQPPFPLPEVPGHPTTPEENKALVRRLAEEVWNEGNLAAVEEIYHPLSVAPDVPQLPAGPVGTRMAVQMFRSAFPDFHMSTEHLLAEGDLVVARFRQQGTHQGDLFGMPATGKRADFEEIALLQVAGGQIIGTWYETDLLGLFAQLGMGASPSGDPSGPAPTTSPRSEEEST